MLNRLPSITKKPEADRHNSRAVNIKSSKEMKGDSC